MVVAVLTAIITTLIAITTERRRREQQMNEQEPQFTIRIGDLRVTEGRQGHRAEIVNLNADGGTSGYVVAWIDGRNGEYDILSVGMRALDSGRVPSLMFRTLASVVFDLLTEIDRVAREA